MSIPRYEQSHTKSVNERDPHTLWSAHHGTYLQTALVCIPISPSHFHFWDMIKDLSRIYIIFLNKSRSTAVSFKKKKYWYKTRRSGHHHTNNPSNTNKHTRHKASPPPPLGRGVRNKPSTSAPLSPTLCHAEVVACCKPERPPKLLHHGTVTLKPHTHDHGGDALIPVSCIWPHAEWSGLVFFFGVEMRVLCWSFAGSEGSTIVCAAWGWQSHGGGAQGGRSGLQRATTSTWHNVGDNGVDVDGLFRTPLPSGGGGGGVLCRVCLCSRVYSCGGVRFGAFCVNASS
jgi:hypothetical protein